MKKSFCDICGLESHTLNHTYKTRKESKVTVCLGFDFRRQPNEPPRLADLCKKCARELLDKIEL